MATLVAAVNGNIFPVQDVKPQFRQNEVGSFTVSLPRRFVVTNDFASADIEIYLDNTLVLSGIVEANDLWPVRAQ